MNVQEVPVGVQSSATSSDSFMSQITVDWDTNVFEFVDEVDIVVFGYRDDDGAIDFAQITTLASEVEYQLGSQTITITPNQQFEYDAGVIGVVESQMESYK